MFLNILVKSFFVGIGGSCVIGPIFLLILNRALKFGFWAGFYSGIGVAASDGLLFALGFTGIISIAAHSNYLARLLELIGALVLILVGFKALFGLYKSYNTNNFWMDFEQEAAENDLMGQTAGKQSPLELFWMGFGLFLLNVTNPMILVFFATVASRVFPELLGQDINLLSASCAACGTFIGSAMVFSTCSFFAAFISKIFVPAVRRLLEIFTALFFIVTGFYLLKNLTNFDFFTNLFAGWFK